MARVSGRSCGRGRARRSTTAIRCVAARRAGEEADRITDRGRGARTASATSADGRARSSSVPARRVVLARVVARGPAAPLDGGREALAGRGSSATAKAAARQCRGRSAPGGDEVAGQEREGAPGEREPRRPCGSGRRRARGCRPGRGRRPRRRTARIQGRRSPRRRSRSRPRRRSTRPRAPTSTRRGIAVRSGRPLSSSSACAPTPSARKNASERRARGGPQWNARRERSPDRDVARGARPCTAGGAA